jgi:hypothetical protein
MGVIDPRRAHERRGSALDPGSCVDDGGAQYVHSHR